MAQQQPVFVTIQPPVPAVAQPQTGSGGYKAAAGRSTGIIQIICGSVSIIIGIASIFTSYFAVGWPLWGGVLYVVTGSLGVPTRQGRHCLIVAYLVMSIISTVSAAGELIWESFGASIHDCREYYEYYEYCPHHTNAAFALHIVALLLALAEMVAAIVGSAFCCHGICCTTNQTTPFVVQYSQQPGQIYSPQQGAPAQYPQQGTPAQYPSQGGPPVTHAQYPPQGASAQIPQGAPPGYTNSAPQEEKINIDLQK